MSEVNETFSVSNASDTGSVPPGLPTSNRVSRRVWEFRPSFERVAVVRKITAQWLPRLFTRSPAQLQPNKDQEKAVETFALLTLRDDDQPAYQFIEHLLAKGATIESIYLDWLAPAARHLGGLWASDEADFAAVTLAVNRLHRVLRDFGDAFAAEQTETECKGSVLLTTIPGEQHSFGLAMVSEFFRRNGWDLSVDTVETHQELRSLVRGQWFDIVGISVSSDRRLAELKQDIADIRRESQNRDVGIMLGGPMAAVHPEMLTDMGADMMSCDAAAAPDQARALAARLKTRSA